MSADDWLKGYNAALNDLSSLGEWRFSAMITELLQQLRDDAAFLKGDNQRRKMREKLRHPAFIDPKKATDTTVLSDPYPKIDTRQTSDPKRMTDADKRSDKPKRVRIE